VVQINEELVIVLQTPDGAKLEYRVWNPFRSKLAAAVLGGVENIYMPPGSKVWPIMDTKAKNNLHHDLRRSCTLVQRQELQSATFQILSARWVLSRR
jgi:hypothetical protein